MTDSRVLQVVFGAGGGLGNAVARELVKRGKTVRAVSRSGKADLPAGIEIVACDAADPAAVKQICRSAAVIFHCANAPYSDWPALLPPMMKGLIAGASATGATLVYGDNLYMYGEVKVPLTEDLPNRADGPKGRTRAKLADLLMDAHQRGEIRATIGRASDFYGPGVTNAFMGPRVFARALAGKPISMLGRLDVPHTYTFVEDFAAGLVTLSEYPQALGETWHIPSAETLTTREFIEKVCAAAGVSVKIRAMPKPMFNLLSLFHPMLREIKEILYEFEAPFIVDHCKFKRAFGCFPTPHDIAIRKTLDGYRDYKFDP